MKGGILIGVCPGISRTDMTRMLSNVIHPRLSVALKRLRFGESSRVGSRWRRRVDVSRSVLLLRAMGVLVIRRRELAVHHWFISSNMAESESTPPSLLPTRARLCFRSWVEIVRFTICARFRIGRREVVSSGSRSEVRAGAMMPHGWLVMGVRSAEMILVIPTPFSFDWRIPYARGSANAVHICLFPGCFGITSSVDMVEVWSLRPARGIVEVGG